MDALPNYSKSLSGSEKRVFCHPAGRGGSPLLLLHTGVGWRARLGASTHFQRERGGLYTVKQMGGHGPSFPLPLLCPSRLGMEFRAPPQHPARVLASIHVGIFNKA